MTTKKMVSWEKYIDPLVGNIDPVNGDVISAGELFDGTRPVKAFYTKLGVVTLGDYSLAQKHFDNWIMHSNFTLTDEIGEKIVKAKGVSLFIPMTRYSCQIGFPSTGLFDITECKLNIQNMLTKDEDFNIDNSNNDSYSLEVKQEIEEKISEFNKEGGLWCMYIMPNGNIESIQSSSVNELFKEKVNLYKTTQQLIGGVIHSNK